MMSENKFKCVFNPAKNCPVRKEIRISLDAKTEINKYIKPMGDKELLKIYSPIIDKLQQMLVNEFGILHNYCAVCMPSKVKG